jgi:hypothetical protein
MIEKSIQLRMMKGVLASTPALNERKNVSRDTEVCLYRRTDYRRMSTVYGASLFGDIITDCLTVNTVCYAL